MEKIAIKAAKQSESDPAFWSCDLIKGGIQIATVNGVGKQEAEKNALLMARAQELFASLLKLRQAFYIDGKTKAIKKAFEETHALTGELKNVL